MDWCVYVMRGGGGLKRVCFDELILLQSLSLLSPLMPTTTTLHLTQAELSAAKSKAAALSKEKAEMAEAHERALASLREAGVRMYIVCGGLVWSSAGFC